jgi:hypothetical protein
MSSALSNVGAAFTSSDEYGSLIFRRSTFTCAATTASTR